MAGLASSDPSAAVFLKGCPHEALGDKLSRCPNPAVAEGMEGIENLEAEGRRNIWTRFTEEVSQYSSTYVSGMGILVSCSAVLLATSALNSSSSF